MSRESRETHLDVGILKLLVRFDLKGQGFQTYQEVLMNTLNLFDRYSTLLQEHAPGFASGDIPEWIGALRDNFEDDDSEGWATLIGKTIIGMVGRQDPFHSYIEVGTAFISRYS